ncbi:uncharacterized protein LOC117335166 isoform X1 [Pecten maximus]|uniref:uncharacterized protein LOC117335166 isoform X1 n=1 Tax=Pecten maximus TaxID=6579 RepID=UPI0014582982|nr:uncharacterized protein LOC117335166 isoform X1 [Pecten maximus]
MTTHQTVPSPDSPYMTSPVAFVQPRHKDKGSYVQRWKVLRERNRNLPKLDFNVNKSATKRPQKTAVVGIARSLTMESMKLPSISTSSVITTATNGTTGGASIKTTGSGPKKANIQVLIHFSRWRCGQLDSEKRDRESQLNAALSKSLPNIATSVQQDTKAGVAAATKHRFEKFAHTKKLSRRNDEKEKEEDGQHLVQSGV